MSAPHAEAVRNTSSGAWHVTLWVLQVAIAALFLFGGGMKLAGAPPMVELFDEIGFGQWFRFVTGGLEIVGAVALLIPRLVAYGALLLAGVMAGAVVTELALGGPVLAPLAYLVVTAIIAWGRRDRLPTPLWR
ncbi:MAG: DoxX family membrane protein [Pseudonocardiaceae bacterium]|nr:DoxX family membrane protein [Pseudonocardiaceae bacterium]